MKKIFTIFITTLFCTLSFAQTLEADNPTTETSLSTTNTFIERPDVLIKGDELKNFLGRELSEVLLGRLPGADHINTSNQDSKVVFVVDGIVWANIDAININNVEEIAYYRGGLSGKLGFQNTGFAGIIFITTKTAKLNQRISAEVNTLMGNNSFKNIEKKSTFQSYNVALSQGIEQLSWRASTAFNKATRNLNGYDFNHQFQLNASVNYNPAKWLELKLNANYAPINGVDSNSTAYDSHTSNQNFKYKQGNWNGLMSAKISPLKGLTNEISFSKIEIKEDEDNNLINISSHPHILPEFSINLRNEEVNNLILTNDLRYRFNLNQDRIIFNIGSFYQYHNTKHERKLFRRSRSGGSNSRSEGLTEYNGKFHSVIGDFSISLYDILSLRAGFRGDIQTETHLKTLYSPFYYSDINLKRLLFKAREKIDAVSLFGSYGEYIAKINFSAPEEDNKHLIMTGSRNERDKLKIQNYGLRTSFFDNRLHISGDWYRNDNYAYLYTPIPRILGFGGYVVSMVSLKVESWRTWSSADILKNTKFKWTTGISAFRNQNIIKTILVSGPQIEPGDNLKPTIQTGTQQKLSYSGFLLDVNAYAYFNNLVFDIESDSENLQPKQSSFLSLNYIYLGYDFKKQLNKYSIKNLNIGIVSKNNINYQKNIASSPTLKSIAIALNASF